MMEELKKNFELMKKKQIKIKKDDKENQENKKDINNNNIQKNKIINNDVNQNFITSVKDKIKTFEKLNKETEININKSNLKGKGPPKKTNINNVNVINIKNNIDNNICIPKKDKKSNLLTKSFTISSKKQNILNQNNFHLKYSHTIHTLNNMKLNLNNFSTAPKKNLEEQKEDINTNIKINEVEYNENNNSIHQEKEKDNSTIKKRNSLLDENGKLVVPLKSKKIYTKDDFEIINFLGKGAYGTVLQVILLNDINKKIYAIKKLDINSLISVNRLYQAYLENEVLSEINSPYIIKVHGAFEADEKIHLIMDYMPKGDLAHFIKANYPLRPDLVKFYSAEMVCFLEDLQKNNLIHRDLKPQNIMIDENGHLKVIDFGTVRKIGYYFDKKEMKFKEENTFEIVDSEDIKGVKNIVNPDEEDIDEEDEEYEEEDDDENDNNIKINKKSKMRIQRSMTFVGTSEYISPEVIADKPADFGTDIWAFGVMLYQMIFNTTPFFEANNYLTFRKIESVNFNFPKDSNDISEEAKDLLKKIFVLDPKKRLGGGQSGTAQDIEHLKKHKFFKNIKWNNLHNMTIPGFKDLKFHEIKRKSIYKKGNSKKEPESYEVFNDGSNKGNIKVIKEGYIKKKSSWFHYEKIYIVLDTTPKIVETYINDKGKKKSVILSQNCRVSLVDNNVFDLKTPQKNHRYKGLSNDGNDWAGIIDDAIKGYA